MSASRRSRLVSGINVTPLVDVVLVLLIIFMVTAPFMKEGLPVDLPEVEAKALPSETQDLIVSIDKKGSIEINGAPIDESRLSLILRQIKAQRKIDYVYLQADKKVEYGYVARIIGAIKNAGLTKLGLVTQPPPPKQKR
ncbi:MAG: biopolymer transporter ExbD [Deltaproteobacteria bacterium]|nr:biopolymer transporter ExbD [Deltaproteobacteria bacterium]